MDSIQLANNQRTIVDSSQLDVQAKEYLAQSHSERTIVGYQRDWNNFVSWCDQHSVVALPATAETVVRYITDLASTLKYSTIQRRLVAISQVHKSQDVVSPTAHMLVRNTLKGIARSNGTAQAAKAPTVIETLRVMVDTLDDTPFGIRDRALLLVGFAGAFRRSELVGLNIEDVQFTREGAVITLRKSKTDQEGQGRKIGIPYGSAPATCPVRALQDWLEAAQITTGALFRIANRYGRVEASRLSDKAVARAVKRTAERAGLDPKHFSGHSLRAGLATQAAKNGASERSIMQQTGHRSVNMVRRYIRDGSLFTENAAASMGL